MAPTKPSRRLTVFMLRFLLSKGEYERLECILSPHTPNSIRPHLPSTADFDERPRSPNREIGIVEAALGPRDDFLPATARQGLRVFAGTYAAATLVDVVLIGIIKRHGYVSLRVEVDCFQKEEYYRESKEQEKFPDCVGYIRCNLALSHVIAGAVT